MKKMKRMISLLMSLLMLAALAACGAQPQPDTPAGPDKAETTEEQKASRVAELASPVLPQESIRAEIVRTGLDAFTGRSLPVFFADLNGENRVYSPLNVYMALAMLAEVSDGSSREQLLALLGENDTEALRAEVKALWEASYRNEELLTILPAASVWLRDDGTYKSDVLQVLADSYYASAFSGTMGDPAYTAALHDWINERTNHLLEEQAEKLSLDPDTVMALVTTLYFKGRWAEAFDEARTTEELFHALSGDLQADFMHKGLDLDYYRGTHFAAICLPMHGRAGMWLLLPDEDSSLQELIDSGEAAAFLRDPDTAEGRRCHVQISLPRFDVDSDLDLIGMLQSLGVTDVFGPNADFSPLSEEMRLLVDQIQHAARVKIDEEGCEAAAFTAIMVKNAAMDEPLEEVAFTCDRPFFFAVVGDQGQMLFAGAVNTPQK
ncbi:MAG: hypothetical protein IJK35_04315 [Oscillospiraceae bacterium]|nr:hypothetical protein [Oscillospiraceae bacterium]